MHALTGENTTAVMLGPELSGARSRRHLRALFHCSAPEKSLLSLGVVPRRWRAFDVLRFWSPEQQPEDAITVYPFSAARSFVCELP